MGLSPEDLTGRHLQIIKEADILVGGKRLLDYFKDSTAGKKIIDKNIHEAVDFIKESMATRSIVVLASGDPLFFGIGSILVSALGPDNVVIYPNISSIAAAFARIKEPWNKVRVVSLHGRKSERELFKALDEENVVAVLTDPSRNPAWIAKRLVRENWVNFKICVLESLGTANEHVNWYRPAQAAAMTFAEPNLVIIKRCIQDQPAKQPPHLGIPDQCYAHERGLITKSEIRAITLAKLRLLPHHILWDLGAGSGSVSVEASLLVNRGKVFAVEKNPKRIKQIEINKGRFGIVNLEILEASVPDGLAQLPKPDRIFIGGGGKALKAIITGAVSYLKHDGRVVINTVLMPNIQAVTATLTALGFTTDVVQVQINRSRRMPWAERLEAQNPVWIISGFRI
ncbi:MAG: precorrin-6y C5,15-methyltransferase (decarboxylating) subunit CbiE [Desulfobacterales bacterium]|nr:MAG: precorrin-6y C5,15-methyltransferase (decarboxylating) subunit CbiE [Desulfobacterales bacterium]